MKLETNSPEMQGCGGRRVSWVRLLRQVPCVPLSFLDPQQLCTRLTWRLAIWKGLASALASGRSLNKEAPHDSRASTSAFWLLPWQTLGECPWRPALKHLISDASSMVTGIHCKGRPALDKPLTRARVESDDFILTPACGAHVISHTEQG